MAGEHHKSSVLVLGRNRQVIGIARSLADLGLRVIVGRSGRPSFVEKSRAVADIWRHPSILEQPAAFVAALAELAHTRRELVAVFPAGEEALRCLTRAREVLPRRLHYLMPSPDAVEACLDKTRCYEVADCSGVSLPAWRSVQDLRALAEAAEEIGFPCVVKPNTSEALLCGAKCLRLEKPGDVARAFSAWPREHREVIVQRYVNGLRHNCNFAASRGNLLSYAELRVLRTSELDGTGNLVDARTVAPDPRRRAEVAALVSRLGYTGIGCAQFMVDDTTRESAFLELNPRIASCVAFGRAGFDLPRMAVECVDPELSSLVDIDHCREGVRAAWLLGDAQGFARALLARKLCAGQALQWLRESLRTLRSARVHVVWNVRDPLPAFSAFAQMTSSLLGPRRRITPRAPLPPLSPPRPPRLNVASFGGARPGSASASAPAAQATLRPRAR